MPKKVSSVKKYHRVKKDVDALEVESKLKDHVIPQDKIELIQNWIKEIIVAVRNYEEDIGIGVRGKLQMTNAQHPIADFSKISKALDDVIQNLKRIDAPRQRYKNNPTRQFYYPRTGAEQLRIALAYELAKIFSPTNFNDLGIDTSEFLTLSSQANEDRSSRGPLRGNIRAIEFDRANFQIAAKNEANSIAVKIIDQIRTAFLIAAEDLEPHRKRGGADKNPIRELIMTNLPQLWSDVFENKPVYVDEVYRAYFDFALSICELLGVPSYCTPYQLKAGIKRWKERTGR